MMNKNAPRVVGKVRGRVRENIDVSHIVAGARVLVTGPGSYSGFKGNVSSVIGAENGWCEVALDGNSVPVKIMRQDLTHIQTEAKKAGPNLFNKPTRSRNEGVSLICPKESSAMKISSRLKAARIPHCLESIDKATARVRVLSVAKEQQDKAIAIGMQESAKLARFASLDFVRNNYASNPSGVTLMARSMVNEQAMLSKARLTVEQVARATCILIAGQKAILGVREGMDNKPQSAGYEIREVGSDKVVKTVSNADEARGECAGRTDWYVCPVEPQNVVEAGAFPSDVQVISPDATNTAPATPATANVGESGKYSSPGFYVVNMEGAIMEGPYGDYDEGSNIAAEATSPSFVHYLDDDNLTGNLDFQPMEDEIIGDGNQYMSTPMDDGGITNESGDDMEEGSDWWKDAQSVYYRDMCAGNSGGDVEGDPDAAAELMELIYDQLQEGLGIPEDQIFSPNGGQNPENLVSQMDLPSKYDREEVKKFILDVREHGF